MNLGPVILDIEGTELSAEEGELLRHPLVGGVILFSRNYHDQDQLRTLLHAIAAVRAELLTCVDQEGGRVQRFRQGFTRLPACGRLGEAYAHDARGAVDAARRLGWLMAAELREVGIDFSFAPVLDLDRGISEVIGDRAFHSDPEVVTALARAYVEGQRQAGMAAVGKHFPGHGQVAADSHTELPVDRRSLDEIENEDLRPFAGLIAAGCLAGIMPAHVIYTALDSRPAGFSRRWIGQVLRQRLGFRGVVFSDDLNMAAAAAAGDFVARATAAWEAGCNALLVCNNRPGLIQVLEGFRPRSDAGAAAALLDLKARPWPGADARELARARRLAGELA